MSNQETLRSLISRASITQGEAAALIAEETKRPCSIRSIRSWLAASVLKSARPCPEWALDALETILRRQNKIL
ncbi:hypothetical protein PkP19E3_33145 (plasmid) [Pseudomonas koreensis]|nr:hypothetical protein PkP19E3_33145 [Pseudomonas koreensis]